MSLKSQLNESNIPRHVAIIMDGNGRWAKKQGNDRSFGHEQGVESVRAALEASVEIGLEFITLYAFSTENWNRPKEEVQALMQLLVQAIAMETPTLLKQNIRLTTIGDVASLPEETRDKLQECIDVTSQNDGLTLVLALSYSGRWEIVDATKKIAEQVKEGKLQIEDIDEDLFGTSLNTSNIPDPELLIRTSGEYRLSNFLLWQLAYSEFYFSEVLWPDFRKQDLVDALKDYQSRERRFGKISEQINK
ncbi:isoprenyl transferase [Halosquirtibacter xylanolyticus]|uniref:isoprenyl transferase n=1 Tax=Halosquirtibacter xylanolyticus TaxID=3374599 RepID=UPI003748B8CF|nr:isoprenyl transferase [Prolixibacteraceae bacterium]